MYIYVLLRPIITFTKKFVMKKILIFLMFIAAAVISAQSNTKKSIDLTRGSVEEKFNEVYTKSSNYQDYKVIKKYIFNQLKKEVLDSLKKEKNNYKNAQNEIVKLQNQINKLQTDLNQANAQIETLTEQKNNIQFLGMNIEKSKYQWIVWSIISVLIFVLIYFIYLYINSQKVTKTAKQNLTKLEEEYFNFKSTALEREQNLKRQLLDERNKNQA